MPDKRDIQALVTPKGVQLHWLVTDNKLTDKFLTGLESHGQHLADTAIFIAAEASIIKQLKAHLNDYCQYDKAMLYASAYWNKKR